MTQGPLPPEPPPEDPPPPEPPPTGPAPEPSTPPVLEPLVPTSVGDPGPQPSPPPAATPPPVAPRSGMSGCAKAAIIGGIVVFVGVIAVLAVVFFGVRRFVGNIDADLGSPDSCQFLTDTVASDALGVTVTAESGESALGSILGIIRDTRLLADEPYCFVSSEDSTTQAWVSAYEGGDAEGVFANAADIADGEVVSSSSDASGSVSVETDPFRGEDVPGLGDEAFCVNAGAAASGGVLARSGNRVVYVSVLPLVDDQGADLSSLCARATQLARAVLES